MRTPRGERGSVLVIAVVVVLIIAVIGVGMVRFTQRETSGALAGQRADALSACASAAQQLLASQFHILSSQPADVAVLRVNLDGAEGRQVAVGGHIGADPTGTLATVKQVERLPVKSNVAQDTVDDVTNWSPSLSAGTGTGYKVTVHCQQGDTSSPTSGRQLEIEYAVRWGL